MGILDFFRKIGMLQSSSGSWKGDVNKQTADDMLAGEFGDNNRKVEEKRRKKEEKKNFNSADFMD
jgi:hypothetical protein